MRSIGSVTPANPSDLRIPHHPLDREVLEVAGAAEGPHGVGGGSQVAAMVVSEAKHWAAAQQ